MSSAFIVATVPQVSQSSVTLSKAGQLSGELRVVVFKINVDLHDITETENPGFTLTGQQYLLDICVVDTWSVLMM